MRKIKPAAVFLLGLVVVFGLFVERTPILRSIGEFLVVPGYTDVSFTNLDEDKVIELTLKDKSAYPHRPIVTVTKKFKLRR